MDAAQIKVLLVEDQEIARVGLTLLLRSIEGLVIVGEAADGFAAVKAASALAPDVVLMDIGLPELDGIDATRLIKEQNSTAKIVMMTSHDHLDDVLAALSAGADGYLLKESESSLIGVAVKIVNKGGVFLEPRIAKLLVRERHAATHGAPCSDFSPDSQRKNLHFGLSPRELEVLDLVVKGFSNPQMAERLFISNETVKTHMRHIMEKLMVADRTQAAVKALRAGLVG